MFLSELSKPQLLVVYPGRFQPFHKGHHRVYQYLTGKFGSSNVVIATSNKTDNLKSPFSFAEKSYFMQLTGVPVNAIIECSQPYRIESILETGRVQVGDPANTVVIFAVSEKDMSEDPRFASWTKKDGSPSYFQPLENIKNTKSMQEHAYIMTVPTFEFTVLGKPMRSASDFRREYTDADEKTRQAMVKDMFGKYTVEAQHLLDANLAPKAPAVPARPNKLPKTAVAAGAR
jgi:phosphopantetheine adenylyltransferase